MRRRIGPLCVAMDVLPLLNLPDGVSIWTAHDLDNVKRRSLKGNPEDDEFKQNLFNTINILGARSQFSQNLVVPLTTVSRLHENSSYTLYLLIYEGYGVGILKVGLKKLFLIHPLTHRMVEVEPMCVLDFYVDETYQRRGFGKRLFSKMLEREQIDVGRIAIDRPGAKFLSFLDKHYGLRSYIPQANNYVVFDSFFDGTYVTERGMLKWGTPPLSCQDSMYGSGMGFSSRKNYPPSARSLLDLEDADITHGHSSSGRSALGGFDLYSGLPNTNHPNDNLAMHNASFYRRNSFLRRPLSGCATASSFSPPSRLSRRCLERPLGLSHAYPMLTPPTAHNFETDALSSRLSRRLSLINSSNCSARDLALEGSIVGNLSSHYPLSRESSLGDGSVREFSRRNIEVAAGWVPSMRDTHSSRYIPTESCVDYDIITGAPL